MNDFFRHAHILVDVEKGLIIDTLNGRQMEISLTNFCMKNFGSRVKEHAIRFSPEESQLLWWNGNFWNSYKDTHGADVAKAISKYIDATADRELLK